MDLLPLRIAAAPTNISPKALRCDIEQNYQARNNITELKSKWFCENQQILNSIDSRHLSFGHYSIKSLSQEIEGLARLKIMSHLGNLNSPGFSDLMKISNENVLNFDRKYWPTMILQNSRAFHTGLSNSLSLTQPAYPIEIEQTISSMYFLSSGDMERQRQLRNLLSIQHSPVMSTREEQGEEINNLKECMLSGFFPVKLHRLLLKLDQSQGKRNIARFVPNGSAFVIIDPQRFKREVMKEYFPRMSSYASFQRQLNLYDFRRTHYGSNENAYYHPSFLRDFPSMSVGIKRTKKKQNKMRSRKIIREA
jgi:hypothetical protein